MVLVLSRVIATPLSVALAIVLGLAAPQATISILSNWLSVVLHDADIAVVATQVVSPLAQPFTS